MNLGAIAGWRAANRDADGDLRVRSRMTRRQFAGAAAGTVVLGAALGSGLFKPRLADTRRSFTPVPVPGGSPLFGGSFHVFAPAPAGADPIDAEPITITNLDGFVGLSLHQWDGYANQHPKR